MAARRPNRPKVPAYSLHKARGLACCKVKGRRIYLGKYGSPESKEAYARVVTAVLNDIPVEPPKADSSGHTVEVLTLSRLTDRYLEHARGYYVKDGLVTEEYRMVARAVGHAVALFGELPATEFGPLCLEKIRDRLIERGLARTTINGSVNRIRRMFRWAGSKQIVPAATPQGLSYLEGLKAGRTQAREPVPVRPVDDDTIEKTVRELPGIVADMVRLQRLTGMRPGEVTSMRPCDLDRAGETWIYRPAQHKTQHHGRERTVFIGPKGQAILLRYLVRDPESNCFRPCDSEQKRRVELHAARKTPLSCGNRPGTNRKARPFWRASEKYSKDSYAQAIRRACDRAGVERWSPNQLRHTAATEVRREFGLEAAQIILGHSSMKTSEIYAEKNLTTGARVAMAVG